jgi:phosphoglycolate phosphatase
MNKTPELIIFDWDGTVVDSTQTIVAAIQQACQDLGLAVPNSEAASYVIGLGLHDALNHIAPGLDADKKAALGERFRHHYLMRDQYLRPFPGMMELFLWLKDAALPLAVATGKSRKGLDRAMETTQTAHFFKTSRCADETDPKPAPTMVHEICAELEIAPDRALVVGDTTHDIFMAKSAGATALAVTYGAHDLVQLKTAEPFHFVNTVSELHTWMKKWITQ